jgi:hypothetical protein
VLTVKTSGSFSKSLSFLQRMKGREEFRVLSKYGSIGVTALTAATPMDSGKTAGSWYYEIVDRPGYFAIHWLNSNVEEPGNIPVAAIIQYGHGTRRGGYVQGIDYVNPALRSIFDQIIADMWKEVTR